jgi:carbamoyltransferase
MIILGVNETSHDASVSMIKDGEILFAGHAERYSKQKNDWYINDSLVDNALSYGAPDAIAYYEKPLLKASRLFLKGGVGEWKPKFNIEGIPRISFKHHYSHACAGYYTSKFDNAVIVVLDSIGEFNTSTIWVGEGSSITLKKKINYPFSFGLFYSAFTQLVGLMPNQEEYIMMGMAAYGDSEKYLKKVNEYFPSITKQKYNFHKGITDWGWVTEQDKFDIAAAVQRVYQSRLIEFMIIAKKITGKNNLVFMGGCALNCSANTLLWDIFDDVWIMPNPGDAGSSLGAAAALYGKHLNWKSPYLGYDLGGKYPVDNILNELINHKIAAVATGRAEFGPRALGNRSILADPRDPNIKDKVNEIKKRELFRPFAPMVLEEEADKWFDMDFDSPYMQYAVRCLKPELIPSVVHKDGTSRVQTVNKEQNPDLHELLLRWYKISGVPVLLNTSLNIKGQPLINDRIDILEWEKMYKTKIIKGV